jgi:hypothetical protein
MEQNVRVITEQAYSKEKETFLFNLPNTKRMISTMITVTDICAFVLTQKADPITDLPSLQPPISNIG